MGIDIIEDPDNSSMNFEPQPTIQNGFNHRINFMISLADSYAMNKQYDNWRLTLETIHRSLIPLMDDKDKQECIKMKNSVRKTMNSYHIALNQSFAGVVPKINPIHESQLVEHLSNYDTTIKCVLHKKNLLMN